MVSDVVVVGTGSGEATVAVGVAGSDRAIREWVPLKRHEGCGTAPCSATITVYYCTLVPVVYWNGSLVDYLLDTRGPFSKGSKSATVGARTRGD